MSITTLVEAVAQFVVVSKGRHKWGEVEGVTEVLWPVGLSAAPRTIVRAFSSLRVRSRGVSGAGGGRLGVGGAEHGLSGPSGGGKGQPACQVM